MKRTTLVAGAALAAGVGWGAYALTARPDPAERQSPPAATTAAERSAPAATVAPAPALPAARAAPASTPSAPPGAPAPEGTTPAAAPNQPATEVRSEARVPDPDRAAARPLRTGERALARPRTGEVPATFAGEDGIAHQKRLRRTVEAAACRAPDIEARFEQMPAADAEKLRKRCAAHGVTLGAKR